jgi:hypothetical protein
MKWKIICCVTNANLMHPRYKRGRLVEDGYWIVNKG